MSAPSAKGFVTLISVLILGAVGVAVVVSLIQLGLGSSRTSFATEQSVQARAFADACGEVALDIIRNNSSYTGTANVALGGGSCSYTVTNTGGTTRSVTAVGTVGTIARHLTVAVATVSPVTLTTWQEVAN